VLGLKCFDQKNLIYLKPNDLQTKRSQFGGGIRAGDLIGYDIGCRKFEREGKEKIEDITLNKIEED